MSGLTTTRLVATISSAYGVRLIAPACRIHDIIPFCFRNACRLIVFTAKGQTAVQGVAAQPVRVGNSPAGDPVFQTIRHAPQKGA